MAVLPTLLGLLVLIRRQLGAVQFSSAYFWWLAAICVLPLSLHLVAFDTFRIWVYPLFVALLSLWVVCDTVTIAPPSRRAMSWLGACCLIVIPVNILVDYPLFNKNPLEITPDVKLLLYLPGLAVMALVCSKSEKGVLREERSHR
jgi:hypothetical protein